MSSYVIHLCISEKVRETLNLGDKFLCGSILPDLLKMTGSPREKTHYIKRMVIDKNVIKNLPDIDAFKKDCGYLDDEELKKGYMAHLIEDKIWFNKYIPKYQEKSKLDGDASEFCEEIYLDYTKLNSYIQNKYDLDILSIKEAVHNTFNNPLYDEILTSCTIVEDDGSKLKSKYITKEDIEDYMKEAYDEVLKEIKSL